MSVPAVLYAAFEAYPGLKGAQTHIRHCLKAVDRFCQQVQLICLGNGERRTDPETGALLLPVCVQEPNFLRRTEQFGHAVRRLTGTMTSDPPRVLHFRDIWSGVPLLDTSIGQQAASIYEVNGLPSLELTAHYPELVANQALLSRIRRMEQYCLEQADQIITVSRVNRDCLVERGVDPANIRVLPNPAAPPMASATELPEPFAQQLAKGSEILLYVGTLAPWQGIATLLEAVNYLRHRQQLHLVLVAPTRKWVPQVVQNCSDCGIADQVTILTSVPHAQVQAMLGKATLSVAPLARGMRNEQQGCSPFKIVESMACGVPVVASDLPVVRELLDHGTDGWLVAPGSARALAGGIETLLDNRALRLRLAAAARKRSEQEFSISLFEQRIRAVYEDLIVSNKRRWL